MPSSFVTEGSHQMRVIGLVKRNEGQFVAMRYKQTKQKQDVGGISYQDSCALHIWRSEAYHREVNFDIFHGDQENQIKFSLTMPSGIVDRYPCILMQVSHDGSRDVRSFEWATRDR